MKTRIKYFKKTGSFHSETLINFEGERFQVIISKTELYILTTNGSVVEFININSIQSAKKLARKLLINKYQVRLNEEIRIRK